MIFTTIMSSMSVKPSSREEWHALMVERLWQVPTKAKLCNDPNGVRGLGHDERRNAPQSASRAEPEGESIV
jgi:hypothetical protein